MPDAAPADTTEVFKALCESRALRWRNGEWDWIGHAVDPLQQWAVDNGLVKLIGQDEVQRLMSEAFHD